MPIRLALVVIQTVHWLREQGLREGRDYTLVDAPSFNSAAYAVQQHQAMLAIMSPASMRQLPEALKDDTLVFQTLPEIPALMWVAHPRMRAEVELLRATLLGFTAELPEGKQFFDATGYRGIRAVSADDMTMLTPYADEIKALLGPPR
ncbi:MAG: phosphate/phosphite/phosphonate ABC transporter substrate-binding protein [Chromatiales bacterium]|nr:phosphate/phosphite/phosphonate ABC transporter substrate-binding protein [Chromatiales bacterium]